LSATTPITQATHEQAPILRALGLTSLIRHQEVVRADGRATALAKLVKRMRQ
jgi:hypothetical protein